MRKTDTLKKGVNAMISVIEILESEEFKNSAAVQAAIDILGNALSYVDNYCDNSCMEADQLDELIYNYRPLEWGCGATKVAVLFKDFVLKSNYSQVVEWDEGDYDEENETYVNGGFTNPCDWEDCDYCWIESRVYEKAVEAGVAAFFAPTIPIGNTGVYIQPRADREVAGTDWYKILNGTCRSRYEMRFGSDAFNKLRKELKLDNVSSLIFSYWLDNMSYVQLKKLGQFLHKHCINDLHNHNIGWFGDKILLFDYSGYHSGTEDTL